MSSIKSRLRRLEKGSAGETCLECSFPPGAPGRIVHERIPEGEPEFCPSCGRPLWTVIKVVYDDEEGEGVLS